MGAKWGNSQETTLVPEERANENLENRSKEY